MNIRTVSKATHIHYKYIVLGGLPQFNSSWTPSPGGASPWKVGDSARRKEARQPHAAKPAHQSTGIDSAIAVPGSVVKTGQCCADRRSGWKNAETDTHLHFSCWPLHKIRIWLLCVWQWLELRTKDSLPVSNQRFYLFSNVFLDLHLPLILYQVPVI